MADTEEGKETGPRGIEWEVVSLTASAYAASPSPAQVDSSQDSQTRLDNGNGGETSNAMFMSSHFVFPPSQHENLPIEPELNEMHSGKDSEDALYQLCEDERHNSDVKDEENSTIVGLISNEFPGIKVYDEKGNTLSVSGAEFRKDVSLDKVRSICTSAEFSSFDSETSLGMSNNIRDGAETDDYIKPHDGTVDPDLPSFQKPLDRDIYDGTDLPCEAWWKRRAFSLYAHAKETHTVWSIFIATAVMGLVIIGHQWQHERWQLLRLRWQIGITDERMCRLLAPISRLKDVVVGGHRRGSLLRGSTSSEH